MEIYLPMCTVPISLIQCNECRKHVRDKIEQFVSYRYASCMTATAITLHSDNVKQFAKILVVHGTLTPHGKAKELFSVKSYFRCLS